MCKCKDNLRSLLDYYFFLGTNNIEHEIRCEKCNIIYNLTLTTNNIITPTPLSTHKKISHLCN